MYEELVKNLRNDSVYALQNCDFDFVHDWMLEAADAIEALSMKLHGDEAAIAGMKREIERMVVASKPRWISVTERLPDKFQSIFAACKSEGRENWTIDTVYDPFLECPWGPIPILEAGTAVVYAWMDNSTPEPPKEE